MKCLWRKGAILCFWEDLEDPTADEKTRKRITMGKLGLFGRCFQAQVDSEPNADSSYGIYVYPSADGVIRHEVIGDKRVRYTIEEIMQKDRQEVKIGIFMIRQHTVTLKVEDGPNKFEQRELEECAKLDETLIPEVVRLAAECCPDEILDFLAIHLEPKFHLVQDRFINEILRVDLKTKSFEIESSTELSETYIVRLLQSDTLDSIQIGVYSFDGRFTDALEEPLKEFIVKRKNRKAKLYGSPVFDGDYVKDFITSWRTMRSPTSRP
ncbi:hypothetical protein QR680_014663 [Steinernema hermaphroditum]|uniref:Uncharacterized protein n=1 Tax=Steinernema hermaphroditum TaxID=289476 RepID=A0AA39IBX9_9BILA|nr:hypothetical protein QR680_014663 [Steinernema hermaphroditum]